LDRDLRTRERVNPKRRFEIVPARVAAELPKIAPRLPLLKLCDGTRTVETLGAESGLSPDEVGRILSELLGRGVVREAAAPSRRALSPEGAAWAQGQRLPAFSDDEEQFFAAPIDHLLEG
jgi:hypothetical protein